MITDGQGGAGQIPAGWWGMTQARQMPGNWELGTTSRTGMDLTCMFTNRRVVEADEDQGVGEIEEGMQRLNTD